MTTWSHRLAGVAELVERIGPARFAPGFRLLNSADVFDLHHLVAELVAAATPAGAVRAGMRTPIPGERGELAAWRHDG